MCALVGSYDLVKFKELIALNSSRGSHSWSATIFTRYGDIRLQVKNMGEFNLSFLINAMPGDYVFGHIQAPTTEARGMEAVHPAISPTSMLWHNGILLPSTIAQLQVETGLTNEQWDTKLLAAKIDKDGWDGLLDLKGSFSCARYTPDNGLHFFRNDISPLYYDAEGNISSTEFEGSVETAPGRVYTMSFQYGHLLTTETTFKNKESPFFFFD